MKYKLNEELRSLEHHKMPANIKLLPAMNAVRKAFKCRSDEYVNVNACEIPGYEDAKLSALIVEPRGTQEVLPCLVFYHGGGFMLNASESHCQLVKEYAAKMPCRVVFVDYRLAPKYQFPIPAEDCFFTYKWVLEHADELKVDRERIILGGDSAGGNLTAATVLMARDRGLQLPLGVMMIYPVVDRRMSTESMKKYADAPVWDLKLSRMMWKAYLGEQKTEHIEYASPLEAPSLKNFPKTYMEVAEFDCLRDEGILFHDRLKEEGITAELHEIKEASHGYENVLESRIMRDALQRRVAWLQKIARC